MTLEVMYVIPLMCVHSSVFYRWVFTLWLRDPDAFSAHWPNSFVLVWYRRKHHLAVHRVPTPWQWRRFSSPQYVISRRHPKIPSYFDVDITADLQLLQTYPNSWEGSTLDSQNIGIYDEGIVSMAKVSSPSSTEYDPDFSPQSSPSLPENLESVELVVEEILLDPNQASQRKKLAHFRETTRESRF